MVKTKNTSNFSAENEFEKGIVSEYLKYGSVDKLLRKNDYSLPISYPGVQRLLSKWGIVKAAGPNSTLSEAICFFTCLSQRRIPLERMYRLMPPSFKTSLATMHRILHFVKEGVVRRFATALVVTIDGSPSRVLIANDISTPRLEIGKRYDSISLPTTFSKEDEDPRVSIKRVMQQELFTELVLKESFPEKLIPINPKPFMYLHIADIRVAVYNITIPNNYSVDSFSSFKLKNFRFIDSSELVNSKTENGNIRTGVEEIAEGYQKYLLEKNEMIVSTISLTNLALAET